MDSTENYLIENIFNLFPRNSINVVFSALKERINAVMKDITHSREQMDQSESEKREFLHKVNDQHLEISSLQTSLVDQTKVRQCFFVTSSHHEVITIKFC